MDQSITFETKVWEQDYRQVLTPQRLGPAIARNCHQFDRRVVFINNVERKSDALRRADRLIQGGVIDEAVVVEHHAEQALKRFGLMRETLGRGYVYSISELVSLHLATTDLVLHFAGDTVLSAPYDWLADAQDILARRPEVAVVNVSWSANLDHVRSESHGADGAFLLGQGFSDQMYLVRTREFAQRIYGETNPASERYPIYGGELFEKRVDAWMRNHGRLRATWTGGHYVHENIRRRPGLVSRVRRRIRG